MNENPRAPRQSGHGEHPRSRARAGGSARPIRRPAPPRRGPQNPTTHQHPSAPGRVEQPEPSHPNAARGSANPRGASTTEPPTAPFPAGQRHDTAARPGSSDSRLAPLPSTQEGSTRVNPAPGRRPRTRLTRRARLLIFVTSLVLVAALAWPIGLGIWANSRIQHVDALSGAADTPGTTTLIAGADIAQGEAQRTDTLMLLHKADNGNTYLVSIPRDTLVNIPGRGGYKINAAYAFGGAPLLVKTVEQFTGLTIDRFAVIGFDGVTDVVDAVDHVNLCIDRDVNDEKSGLNMTEGCHDVGGEQALAFVRARYFDPTADLGRQQRQQQFVGALSDRISSPGVLLNPFAQVNLAAAGSASVMTDNDTGLLGLAGTALTMRSAMNNGGTLQMPIENPEFMTKHSGVAIKVDDEKINAFFRSIEDGSAETAKP